MGRINENTWLLIYLEAYNVLWGAIFNRCDSSIKIEGDNLTSTPWHNIMNNSFDTWDIFP